MTGEIKQFGRKGYEAISRETLQDRRLSYGATGLLCELASYDPKWRLYKKELYERRDSNKRTAVEGFWKELMCCGYIVQYRKRVGKKYEYQYIFSAEQYRVEELEKLHREMVGENFELHMSNKMISLFINNILEGSKSALEIWSLKNIDRDLLFEMLKTNIPKNVDLERFLGVLNLNSSKSTPKRTSINNNPKEEEEEYIKSDSEKLDSEIDEMLKQIDQEMGVGASNKTVTSNYSHSEVEFVKMLLLDSNIPEGDTSKICDEIDGRFKELFVIESIVAQLDWIVGEVKSGKSFFDLPKYFITGLERRASISNVDTNREFADRLTEAYSSTKDIEKPVPMHNWLSEYM